MRSRITQNRETQLRGVAWQLIVEAVSEGSSAGALHLNRKLGYFRGRRSALTL